MVSVSTFALELADVPHVLVAGSTGSGKSVCLNSIIFAIMATKGAGKAQFVLLDPKRVELIDYADCTDFVRAYADTTEKCVNALRYSVKEMERRYDEMQKRREKTYTGSDLYIVIDEFADLVVQAKKEVTPLVIRISQLGRAAKVHLLLATQRPTTDIINGAIKTNMDYRIAFHTSEAQHSRNIIGANGAECLPYRTGDCLYYSPIGVQQRKIFMVKEEDIPQVVKHKRGYKQVRL